jgi:hypothetical protein
MSDTRPHVSPEGPVEQDALDFGALGWFVIILVVTVVVSQVIVWGMFRWFDSRETRNESPRSAMAAEPVKAVIENGRIASGTSDPLPQPALLVEEPVVLRQFFEAERRAQQEYGWVERGTGIVRLPIERAKELVLERGLPVRQAEAPAVPVADAAGAASAAAPAGE